MRSCTHCSRSSLYCWIKCFYCSHKGSLSRKLQKSVGIILISAGSSLFQRRWRSNRLWWWYKERAALHVWHSALLQNTDNQNSTNGENTFYSWKNKAKPKPNWNEGSILAKSRKNIAALEVCVAAIGGECGPFIRSWWSGGQQECGGGGGGASGGGGDVGYGGGPHNSPKCFCAKED